MSVAVEVLDITELPDEELDAVFAAGHVKPLDSMLQ